MTMNEHGVQCFSFSGKTTQLREEVLQTEVRKTRRSRGLVELTNDTRGRSSGFCWSSCSPSSQLCRPLRIAFSCGRMATPGRNLKIKTRDDRSFCKDNKIIPIPSPVLAYGATPIFLLQFLTPGWSLKHSKGEKTLPWSSPSSWVASRPLSSLSQLFG